MPPSGRDPEDLMVYPYDDHHRTAMDEYCARYPKGEECVNYLLCKEYPDAWICETSIIRDAVYRLVDAVTYHAAKTAGDVMFWIARKLRK